MNDDCFSRLVMSQDGHNPGHHCMVIFFNYKKGLKGGGAGDINH